METQPPNSLPVKGQKVVIHVDGPDRVETPVDPCRLGHHRWAWAILDSGGERQVCGHCGATRG